MNRNEIVMVGNYFLVIYNHNFINFGTSLNLIIFNIKTKMTAKNRVPSVKRFGFWVIGSYVRDIVISR